VINLLPPALPSDGKPLLDVNAGGGFSNLLGKPNGEASVTLGDHFAIPGIETENPKPFSFIGSFGYNNLNGGIFDLEESYTGKTAAGQPAMLNQIQSRETQNNRTARGYTGELDFDPNPGVHMYLRGFYSSMAETIAATNLNLNNLDGTAGGSVVNNGNNNFTATGANLTKHFEDSVERTGMGLIEGGGKFLVGNLVTVDLHSAYAEGFDNFGPDWASNFNSNNQNLTINYSTANPNLRTWTIGNAAGRPFAVNNPNNFAFANLQVQSQTSVTQIYDNAISASVPTSFLDTIGTFKVGGDVTFTHRGASQYTVNGTPLGGPFSLASVTGGQGDITNYGGLYDNGTALNRGVYRGLPWSFTPDVVGNQLSQQQDQENVYAGFWQEQLQYGRLGVLAGMRLEATDASYSGFGSTTDAAGNVTVDPHMTTRTQNYVNVFPSVQFSYALTNDLQARFAYSTGIARPGFQQINPANTLTILGGQGGRNLIISGNPNLAPQTVNSYDLALSYYPDGQHDNVLEADLFVKDIANYIAPFTTNTATTSFQTFENLKGAQARGIVLNAIQHFRSLPAPFDGLGINANAAFVDATANIQGQGKALLPETYPLTFNVTEMYEKGPWQFHLLESYTSRNLFSVGTDASTNVYTQPTFRMDADLEYQMTPQWQLWFQAHNLTNTHLIYTQSSSRNFPIQNEYYGQTFLFGMHYHLG
jgi:TonB-dependent receptor